MGGVPGSGRDRPQDRAAAPGAACHAWVSFERWWFTPLVPERLAVLRVCIGFYAWFSLWALVPHFLSYERFSPGYFVPVGLVAVLRDTPLPAMWLYVTLGLALALGLGFIWGYAFRLSGPLFALLVLWLMSYRSSWGMVFHTANLLVIHLIVLALAPSADACSIDARRHPTRPGSMTDGRYGWPVRLMCVATTLTYAIAGWTKWQRVGWAWFTGETLQQQIAYDNLRKLSLGAIHAPLGVALLQWEWVFPMLAGLAFVVELGAPLALCNARLARYWILGIWLFHLGVLGLMAIAFLYPLLGVAFFSFFAVERLATASLFRRLFCPPSRRSSC